MFGFDVANVIDSCIGIKCVSFGVKVNIAAVLDTTESTFEHVICICEEDDDSARHLSSSEVPRYHSVVGRHVSTSIRSREQNNQHISSFSVLKTHCP